MSLRAGEVAQLALPEVKVCVLVKEVPDSSRGLRVDGATGLLDRRATGRLNPFDARALEAALRLRESPAGRVEEIVAVTMGPQSAARVLQRAVAMGADRSVLLCDGALAASDVVATARALAAVLTRESPGLVVLGQQSSDAGSQLLAGALAACLGVPCATQVSRVDFTPQNGLEVERQGDHGNETLEFPLPALIAVTENVNQPRYPTLQGIMAARSRPAEVLSAADAGIASEEVGRAGSRTLCFSFDDPAKRPPPRIIEDRGAATVEEIVSWISEQGVLP